MAKGVGQNAIVKPTIPRLNADSRNYHFSVDQYGLFDVAPQDVEPSPSFTRAIDPNREAVPVPIAGRISDFREIPGSLTFSNGRTVFKPIPGHEHLYHSSIEALRSAQSKQEHRQLRVALADDLILEEQQLSKRKPSVTPAHGTNGEPDVDEESTGAGGHLTTLSPRKGNQPKRVRKPSQSHARDPVNTYPTLSHRVPECSLPASPVPSIQAETTYSFYIGDVAALKHFWKTRLWELTMRPLRQVLTRWIILKWPTRRKWPYDREEKPTTVRPPGWPRNVPYIEPAHLGRKYLVELTCYLLLAVREKDEETGKYRINWIKTLKEAADHTLSWYFDGISATSKPGSEYNRNFREMVMTQIWPSIIETAQNFEDHVAQYDLYEGRKINNPEAVKGKQITWSRAKRIPRAERCRREPPKKRARQTQFDIVDYLDDTDNDDGAFMQGEDSDVDPEDSTGVRNLSFSSTLPDRPPSVASTVPDEVVTAGSTFTSTSESNHPTGFDRVSGRPHSVWNCHADYAYSSPHIPMPYSTEAVTNNGFLPPHNRRFQDNVAYCYQPDLSAYHPPGPEQKCNSSFSSTGYHHSEPLNASKIEYSSEAGDTLLHTRAQRTAFGFPTHAMHMGSGYHMDGEYNVSSIPQEMGAQPNNTQMMVLAQSQPFHGLAYTNVTTQQMAQEPDAKFPALV